MPLFLDMRSSQPAPLLNSVVSWHERAPNYPHRPKHPTLRCCGIHAQRYSRRHWLLLRGTNM
jgi:hypothetical protein